ncbi:MAG: hypothetical protein U5K76_11545 [Woeseiaceae bacterium]|nr:hypothetical protein [Woeseiaceae bacterium]
MGISRDPHRREHAGVLQGANAACGERQVDGAAARRAALARVRLAFAQRDGIAAPRQHDGEQAAAKAGAQYVDGAAGHDPSARCNRSTNSKSIIVAVAKTAPARRV